jgi:hypothetical protein
MAYDLPEVSAAVERPARFVAVLLRAMLVLLRTHSPKTVTDSLPAANQYARCHWFM